MTTTHNGRLRPPQLLELLDPTIRHELDRLAIRPGHRILEIGAGTGEITALLTRLVGPSGRVTAVDKDTSYLAPTAVIDVYHRNLDGDELPGEPDTFDLAIARWLHGALPDSTAVIRQMINRLRPDGWLILADVTETPPRVFRAAEDDATLIHTVMGRIYRTVAGLDGGGIWTTDTETLLLGGGMSQVCVHTSTETWTGGGPGCQVLADTADQLRHLLTTSELTDAKIDRFITLMADPAVVLSSYERRAIHAHKAA
ncbi:methyltransferase domain-containing protein [Micromonospora aurantiaca]|uniref:Methyltransferase domain-containing protein n=1 Tax=Micromonospora aurantiaca (nom. illeg.) TaxID=47850 RepID=A0ABQ6UCB7_9ACTN|nr:class I SAM-dependent methyltransferase [Micromonospora aurantiaca]KAB1108553.1 methyltransferase domain-containing protein [Micromonospora aurantiaca]